MKLILKYLNETPWKVFNEIKMYLLKPIAIILIKIHRVKIESNWKFYGLPKFLNHAHGQILIGKNFENRNWVFSNPLGINHPTIFCTWSPNAQIIIGDDVGMSGGTICASTKVEIGDGTLIGANCTIIDTDFHPLKSKSRRYEKDNIKSKPIRIGKNVFVGTGAIILKGAVIPDNYIIPAGAVIR